MKPIYAFSIADMRQAFDHHQYQFDLVISCDNSVPHLLTDEEIGQAFRQFYDCTRPAGDCLITVRHYDQVTHSGTQVKPYGVRDQDGRRYLVFQVWDFEGEHYTVSMYLIRDDAARFDVQHSSGIRRDKPDGGSYAQSRRTIRV